MNKLISSGNPPRRRPPPACSQLPEVRVDLVGNGTVERLAEAVVV
jgi:hypothetical protein